MITWGHPGYGGNSDNVKEELASGVQHIYSAHGVFAAVKAAGSVVIWGDRE